MLLGMFGTWQMGISCGEGSFLNVLYGRDYILNGKDMLFGNERNKRGEFVFGN